MKKYLVPVVLFIWFNSSSFAQKIDSSCLRIVTTQLNIIKKYLENPNSDSLLKRVGVIQFFTNLTGIPSESDGNYIGQTTPTQRDYFMWNNWLLLNESSLKYDKKSNTIILNKVIQPPRQLDFLPQRVSCLIIFFYASTTFLP